MLNFKEHSFLYSILVIISLGSIFVCGIPFFGDMTYISSVSHFIYNQEFLSIINPINDNGTPPLFSFYFAFIWKIFGKNLIVSHLAILPIFLGLLYQFYKLSLKFISKNLALLALLFLVLDPTISTQYILMGYDIAIVFFFLLALNSIIEKKHLLVVLATVFIGLLNLRGFSIVIAIFIINIYYWKDFSIKTIFKTGIRYIPSAFLVLSWISYHYYKTGWFAVSTGNTDLHSSHSLIWTIKNLAFELIAISSNGRIFIITISAAIFIFLLLKSKRQQLAIVYHLVIIAILSVLPFFLIFTMMAYPVGSRYFMYAYPILYIILALLIGQVSNKGMRLGISILAGLLLIISNFWVNPYPYSNSWDSSLKVLSFFKIQEELLTKIRFESIPQENIYATFPLHKNLKYAYVNDAYDIQFNDYKAGKLNNGDLVIYSNIYNHLVLFNPNNIDSNGTIIEKYKRNNVWLKVVQINQ